MAKNPFGEVSEADVMALFDKDGDLRDPSEREPEEEADEDEPEEEADEPEETEEEDSEEEEDDSESEDEIDWGSVDPRAKEAFDKANAESQKWQKAHAKIQSDWTRSSKARKDQEQDFTQLQGRVKLLDDLESLLEANPKILEDIRAAAGNRGKPNIPQVPEHLKQDPAYQYFGPMFEAMNRELTQLRGTAGKVQTWEQQQQEAKNRQQLDSTLGEAKDWIKSKLGREPSEDDVTKVLQYMVDNESYKNGGLAALAVFGDDYEKSLRKSSAAKMADKAKKFPARTPGVNSRRVGSGSGQVKDPQEAVRAAMREQGINI